MSFVKISLFALLSLARFVLGHDSSYNYGFDTAKLARRQLAHPLVVRGAALDDTSLPLRLEIREMEQDQHLWTLYLLALSMMQYTDQSSPTSWYGITGIHGIPHSTWGGVAPTPGNEHTGYCPHVSTLFPPWHRPYLALYEQVLYSLVQMIAAWWPEGTPRDDYLAAAARFRIPYWDWAVLPPSGQSVLPLSVGGSPYVDIDGPNGMQRISNPLFSYTFKPLNSTAFAQGPWNSWTWTVRAPTSFAPATESNNSWVAMAFDQNRVSLEQRLYSLFSNYPNYSTFSNEAWIPYPPDNNSYDSLESLHDTVHNLAGGIYGHMAYIPYSAFDPIFFLHHAMVDRIFALWQAIHPDSWITPSPARLASYTTSQGQMQDSSTPLTPFYNSSHGTFWTSDAARDHTVFGYTYAELAGSTRFRGNYSRGTKREVTRAVNRLYGSSSPSSLVLQALSKSRSSERAFPGHLGSNGSAAMEAAEKAVLGGEYREWVANVHVNKQALGGSFFIHFFLGLVPRNTQNWASASNLVGTLSVFSSSQMHGMDMNQDISGSVPLTASLLNNMLSGELTGLDIKDVVLFLQTKLRYRVILATGAVVDPITVKSLGISIASACVRAPSDEADFPIWGRIEAHFDLR